MEYIKIRLLDDFGQIGSKFEKTIEDMFRSVRPGFTLAERTWKPPMDMNETPEEVIIVAEVPGVDKDDLEVEISSKAVRIKGKRYARHCTDNATYRLAELQYGDFERVLFLPSLIDPEIVSAAYQNGLLEIRLAKQPPERIHKIPIQDG
ncbi:MAG: Hsp20/alpha crystallin family protein [Deltaproteobacteria bacterium]|jgi:HSP20 family protein|nr:Hsp20/alpha crystallin family protein [Deltaproteobacteria bacterium]MBW2478828.1 Hsp20/alpha crystallin family protein [Deltaproteobacteria bacterium]